MSASLPLGWRFEPAGERPCLYCSGTGKTPTPAAAISPAGVRCELYGRVTRAIAAEYVRLWAPERCTPDKRAELYPPAVDGAYPGEL